MWMSEAREAMAAGMVHEVHTRDAVLPRSVVVAAELGARAPVAYRLAKEQLRRPALERMRGDGATVDGAVVREWEAPHTTQRLREQLDRLSAAR